MSATITKWAQFGSVFKLITKYYVKSFIGPFFNFVFNFILFAILGSIMGFRNMFPGIAAMSAVAVGLQIIPFAIMEMKKSVLLKRIGASPVKPSMFTAVLLIFFLVVILLSTLWIALWALILTQDINVFSSLASAKNAFSFLFGMFANILLAICLGFALASFSRSEIQAQAWGLIIYVPVSFLSGQLISPGLIAENETMNWISRFLPFRYTTMMMVESWSGDWTAEVPGVFKVSSTANIFSVHDYIFLTKYHLDPQEYLTLLGPNAQSLLLEMKKSIVIVLYDEADHIVSFIYPWISTAILGFISIKKFSWSASR